MGSTEQHWTPEQMVRYPQITDLDLSPDGMRVVYTVCEPVLTDDESKWVTHLYCVDTAGGAPLRLTYGTHTQAMPRWSPDGQYIAFLSDRIDNKMSLFVMRADGGEAWPLTDVEQSVKSFRWSPSGARLAFAMVSPESEDRKADKKRKNDPIRWDLDFERVQLWVIPFVTGDVPPAEPRLLTGDNCHVLGYDWFADGERLAFTHQPTPCDDDWPKACLALVELSAEPIVRELGQIASSSVNPAVHGEQIACVTGVQPASWIFCQRMGVYSSNGGMRLLTDTPDSRPYLVGWAESGDMLYALENSGTSSVLLALPVDGGAPKTLIEGQGYFSLVRTNGKGRFACVGERLGELNHICVLDEGETRWRGIAYPVPPGWPTTPIPRSELITWSAPDGLEIEGILTYPEGYEAGRAYPTLVMVHGGPMGVYSQTCVAIGSCYPVASFAERGYLVLRANPRGSTGYGMDFRAANHGDWGFGDYQDIMSGVDALIERDMADPNRLGIMGWSYGGYMTSWAITRTNRFRAASVGAGVTNLMSMVGTSDIPNLIPDYFGAEYWDDLEPYKQHSALFNIKGATTPTLIQHGSEDIRVPLSQGKELYTALKRQGVHTEMVIYPRQGHSASEPRMFANVMRHNLEWFDRWLS